MGNDRSYLVLGAVVVLVFTVGMIVTHPSLWPPMAEMHAWFNNHSAIWKK